MDAPNDPAAKVEPGGGDPLSSTGSGQALLKPKTEPIEECFWEVPVLHAADIKRERESSPEQDALGGIGAEQQLKTEPAESDEEGGAQTEKRTSTDAPASPRDKRHQCTVCQKCFTDAYNLKRHYNVHTGQKPFTCTFCKRKFARNFDLQKHLKIHTDDKKSRLEAVLRSHVLECNVCTQNTEDSHTIPSEKPKESILCQYRTNLEADIKNVIGEKPFKCNICHQQYSSRPGLRAHLNKHTGETPHECNVCHRKFAAKSTLNRHFRIHTAEKPFECSTCQQRFSRKSVLLVHLRTHTGEKPFECDVCNRRFTLKHIMRKHVLTQHSGEKQTHEKQAKNSIRYSGEKMERQFHKKQGQKTSTISNFVAVKCEYESDPECKDDFKMSSIEQKVKIEPAETDIVKGSVDLHEKHNSVSVVAEQRQLCQKNNSSIVELSNKRLDATVSIKIEPTSEAVDSTEATTDRLETTDNSSGWLEVEIQDAASGLKTADTRGATSEARGAPPRTGDARQCHICHKSFSHSGNLKAHLRIHTGEKPFGCTFCNRRFTRKDALVLHITTHTREKIHQCHICNKTFARKQALQTHIKLHMGDKPHQCDVCERSYILKTQLRIHMRMHTGEYQFECEYCKKQFAFKGLLQAHLKIHTGEKPFECNVCPRRFAQKGHLQSHLLTHTGEKPFECGICNRRFGDKQHLQQHSRIHTGEKPFECSVCQKRFGRKSYLKKHLNVHDIDSLNQPL